MGIFKMHMTSRTLSVVALQYCSCPTTKAATRVKFASDAQWLIVCELLTRPAVADTFAAAAAAAAAAGAYAVGGKQGMVILKLQCCDCCDSDKVVAHGGRER